MAVGDESPCTWISRAIYSCSEAYIPFFVMGAHACIIILITCSSMELGWPIIYFSWTLCHHNLSLDQVVFLMFILVFNQVTLYITDGIFHGWTRSNHSQALQSCSHTGSTFRYWTGPHTLQGWWLHGVLSHFYHLVVRMPIVPPFSLVHTPLMQHMIITLS